MLVSFCTKKPTHCFCKGKTDLIIHVMPVDMLIDLLLKF